MFDIFIKRPVLASVVSLLILVVGARALTLLSVRQFPELTNTVITVTTTYPGADAALIKGFVTDPLQQSIASAKGIDYMTSSSVQGQSTVTATIKLNGDPNAAMTEVTAKVSAVRAILPRGINDPVILKTSGQSFAAMYLAFSSDTMKPEEINDYLERVVQPKLATVAGVANPQILGGQRFAVRAWLDPIKLAQYGLAADDVSRALTTNSVLSAAGSTKGFFTITGIKANTDLHTADDYRKLVVRASGAKVVRLGDVATVEFGAQSADLAIFANGKQAVFIGVNLTPDANTLTTVAGVRAILPEIERDLPTGMTMGVPYDSTKFIQSAIDEVVKTLIEAAAIVMVVVFLFMGSLRSMVVPIVALPLSLIGVCLFMVMLGFSINLLTLLAAVLAIGLVVDDAIVVVENIHRHIDEGETPFLAALHGTREIAGPVISMTITLAAVYAPIAFLGGLTGTLFKEFALTLAGSVVVSGVIALTLSPMMSSKVLRHSEAVDGHKTFAMRVDNVMNALRGAYRRTLTGSLKDRPTTVIFAVLVFAAIPYLFHFVDKELAPEEDQGALLSIVQGPPSANIDYLSTYSGQFSAGVRKIPEVTSFFALNGVPSGNTAFSVSVLKPWAERTRGPRELSFAVGDVMQTIPGVFGPTFSPAPLPGADGVPVQMVLTSTLDYPALDELGTQLKFAAYQSGLFIFADTDLKFQSPQTVVDIDHDKAAAYGVTMANISAAFASLTGGNYVDLISVDGKSYRVIPQVPRAARLSPESLGGYYVKTASGVAIPLSSLVTLHEEIQPVSLNQFNQQNSVTLSGAPRPGVPLGTALTFLKDKAAEILPPGVAVDFAGQSRQAVQEGGALYITFGFALIIIFLVLAAQFESFRDPLVIMLTVPLSLFGAMIPLAGGFVTLNIYSEVGLITLVGLITKHGILICEVARQKQEQDGLSRSEAVIEAAALRLRPILMTTAAMISGIAPLMFASGAGAESRHAMSLVIVVGMAVGTLFTLFVLPVIYSFVALPRAKLEAPQ